MSDIEWSDRYGGNYPDPATVCQGECEGMGVIPMRRDDDDLAAYRDEWDELDRARRADNGYHFVKCRECGGTGKRAT